MLESLAIELTDDGKVLLNGEDVTDAIRTMKFPWLLQIFQLKNVREAW